MRTRNWRSNAAEFREMDQGIGWPFAVLVACSVERRNGQGRRRGRLPLLRDHEKVAKASAVEFAEQAGTSTDRVLRYLDAWDEAARAGWVAKTSDLMPDSVGMVMLPDQPFTGRKGVYDARARNVVDEDRREALKRQAAEDGVGQSKVLDIASNPKAMAAAIAADPAVASAARQALTRAPDSREWQRLNRRQREHPTTPSTPLDDAIALQAVIGAQGDLQRALDLARASRFDDEARYLILNRLAQVRGVMDELVGVLGSTADWDAALASLTEGE